MATKHPNLDKMAHISKESNAQGQFLRWLTDTKEFRLSKWCKGKEQGCDHLRDHLIAEFVGDYQLNKLLAEYHDIDYDEMERERRRILDDIRGEPHKE